MAEHAFVQPRIWVGGSPLQSQMQGAALNYGVEAQDATTGDDGSDIIVHIDLGPPKTRSRISADIPSYFRGTF